MNNSFPDSMKKLITPLVVAFILVAGASFYGGNLYAKHTARTTMMGGFGGAGATRTPGGAPGAPTGMSRAGGVSQAGGFVNGEVISLDADHLSVKLPDGGSKNVFYSPETAVLKSTIGTSADLSVGANVSIMGSATADGSVSATSIQIRPTQPLIAPETP